jgi:hypothetical protein
MSDRRTPGYLLELEEELAQSRREAKLKTEELDRLRSAVGPSAIELAEQRRLEEEADEIVDAGAGARQIARSSSTNRMRPSNKRSSSSRRRANRQSDADNDDDHSDADMERRRGQSKGLPIQRLKLTRDDARKIVIQEVRRLRFSLLELQDLKASLQDKVLTLYSCCTLLRSSSIS